MNKYVDRLLEEWKKHGKIIIAVDYDSTLSPWPTIDNKEDIERVIKLLKAASYTGAYIVVFTSCSEDRFNEIQSYCEKIGVKIDGINRNPIDLPYGNKSKVYANVFLDDRAGLNEALDVLETAMYKYRGLQNSENRIDVEF